MSNDNHETSARLALRGFRCAYCGRPLEERGAWRMGAERFYCTALCAEAERRKAGFAPKYSPKTVISGPAAK